MDRERRAVWQARIDIHRRAGRITDGEAYVGRALIKRLGQDGRCDPSQTTLANDSGESLSTVKRALKALDGLGMVSWVRRLIREGWRAVQTSNAYLLTLGKSAEIPRVRCEVQTARAIPKENNYPYQMTPQEARAAQAALADRRRVVEEMLTRK
jgi:DNA-binding transcriptional MocR family regulator